MRHSRKLPFLVTLGALSLLIPGAAFAERARQRTTAVYHHQTGELTERFTVRPGFYRVESRQTLGNGRERVTVRDQGRTFWATVPEGWTQTLRRSRDPRPMLRVPPRRTVDFWQTQVPVVWLPHDNRRERLQAVSERVVKLELEVFPRSNDLLVVAAVVHLRSGAVISLPGTGSFRTPAPAVLPGLGTQSFTPAEILDPGNGSRLATLAAGAEFQVLGRPLQESPDGREYLRVRAPGPMGELTGLLDAEVPREAIVQFTRTPTSREAAAQAIESTPTKFSRLVRPATLYDLENNGYLELRAGDRVAVLGRSRGEGLWLWVDAHGTQGVIDSSASTEPEDPLRASSGAPRGTGSEEASRPHSLGMAQLLRELAKAETATADAEEPEEQDARDGARR